MLIFLEKREPYSKHLCFLSEFFYEKEQYGGHLSSNPSIHPPTHTKYNFPSIYLLQGGIPTTN